MGIGSMREVVETLTALPLIVINSHAHWDHIGNNTEFSDIAIHRDSASQLPEDDHTDYLIAAVQPGRLKGPLPRGIDIETLRIPPSHASQLLSGGERFDLGGRTIETINASGHCEGLLVFLDRTNKVLISTDAAYPAPLYAQMDDSNLDTYRQTMTTLAELVPDLEYVHPSHNSDSMPPEMLIAMRDALDAIATGRQPEFDDGDQARHDFSGFSVLVPSASSKD
jgi:glyoxylase-like metal-dependent hydrolase (beta-lactamase superfamily II)